MWGTLRRVSEGETEKKDEGKTGDEDGSSSGVYLRQMSRSLRKPIRRFSELICRSVKNTVLSLGD